MNLLEQDLAFKNMLLRTADECFERKEYSKGFQYLDKLAELIADGLESCEKSRRDMK